MIKSAKEYHDHTGYKGNMISGHQLDWFNQPTLFKDYKGVTRIPLPEPETLSAVPLNSIEAFKPETADPPLIDINTLSTVLHLTCAITAKAKYSGENYYYRSAASAGALYPVEIYLVCSNVEGLDDGVYNYSILKNLLFEIRKGDFSEYISTGLYADSDNKPAVSFILSSIFFRSSWKYRDRAYRYHLLDTGHVMANLILALQALNLPFLKTDNFNDTDINQLIGADEHKEAALSAVTIPGSIKADKNIQLPPLKKPDVNILRACIVSGNEIDYPAIREIHDAGRMYPLSKNIADIPYNTLNTDEWTDIETADDTTEDIPYPECLFRRRSKRNFIDEEISRTDFMKILHTVSEVSRINNREIIHTMFFAEKVENLAPGLYYLNRPVKKFGMMKPGLYGNKIANTCLNQGWLKNAGIHFVFSCNLEELDKTYGPRAYRYAMMDAGRTGQLLYIAAASLGLGCCGIGAFYDDEALELTGLNDGQQILYFAAAGKIKA